MMDELSEKDQKKLHDLLQRYDQLIEQLEEKSAEIDPENAKKLYDLYEEVVSHKVCKLRKLFWNV